MFDRVIILMHHTVVDPAPFEETPDGFQEFLSATGVRFFSAREMTTPNHPDRARAVGFDHLLPGHEWWDRGAALAAIADDLRELVSEPVRMRNWWRPPEYNARVGGAEASDHVTAHAVDLDYRSSASRRSAEARLRQLAADEPWLQMSLGLGARTTHVGVGSPKGAREWHYSSYPG